jgi:hypothetical protein
MMNPNDQNQDDRVGNAGKNDAVGDTADTRVPGDNQGVAEPIGYPDDDDRNLESGPDEVADPSAEPETAGV